MKALQIEHLSKTYFKRDGPVVSDISLQVEAGKTLALLGESGSGKTTLLRLIAGLEHPDKGAILIGNQVVADTRTFVKPENRKVGLVFQNLALFPHLSIFENVSFGLRGISRQEKAAKVEEVLTLVNLCGMENRFPHQLSGGQQQRVALARALAPKPEVILLDEPFSNLDSVLKNQVREEIKKILKQASATTIFVTHDTTDALLAADKIALMHHGRILQTGNPVEIYTNPSDENVARFFGKINTLHLHKTESGWHSEAGEHLNLPDKWTEDQLKIIFRPENVNLVKQSECGLAARLVASDYMGDHCLLTVSAGTPKFQPHLLFIKAPANHNYRAGNLVFFQIDFHKAKIILPSSG